MENVTCNKCGAENFYFEEKRGPHLTAICSSCGSYIKHLGQKKEVVIHFGKYKGTKLSDMKSQDQISWLKWVITVDNVKPGLKDSIKNYLGIS